MLRQQGLEFFPASGLLSGALPLEEMATISGERSMIDGTMVLAFSIIHHVGKDPRLIGAPDQGVHLAPIGWRPPPSHLLSRQAAHPPGCAT